MNDEKRAIKILQEKYPDKKYVMLPAVNKYRIMAIREFGEPNSSFHVRPGDFGGLIYNEDNLSQEGNCWVTVGVTVDGNARVSDNAWIGVDIPKKEYDNYIVVTHDAKVKDSVIISYDNEKDGKVIIKDSAVIEGTASIYSAKAETIVSENANIRGNAFIGGVQVKGHAIVKDDASITGENIIVRNYALICDNAKVTGKNFEVRGNSIISGNAKIFNSKSLFEGIEKYDTNISGYCKITGNAVVANSIVCNHATISGGTVEDSYISGRSTVQDVAYVNNCFLRDNVKVANSAHIEHVCLEDNVVIKDNAQVFGWVENSLFEYNGRKDVESLEDMITPLIRENVVVSGNAIVREGNTRIMELSGNAEINGNAQLFDEVVIMDNAKINGNAIVSGNSTICGTSIVTDHAHVYGEPLVTGFSVIQGGAEVCGKTKLYGTKVEEFAVISGAPIIKNNVTITGRAHIKDNAEINGEEIIIGGKMIIGGNSKVYGRGVLDGKENIINMENRLSDDSPVLKRSDLNNTYNSKVVPIEVDLPIYHSKDKTL